MQEYLQSNWQQFQIWEKYVKGIFPLAQPSEEALNGTVAAEIAAEQAEENGEENNEQDNDNNDD